MSLSESFSALLRIKADPIWQKIFNHPFLREIQQGTLPLEKFRYYLAQDYVYLEGFGRAVSLALAKTPDSRNLKLLSSRILTPIERPLHQKLMPLISLSPEDVKMLGHAPTNLAYINHMIRTAALGGLGQSAAALLPCPWNYHQLSKVLGPVDHPVYSRWVSPYAGGLLEESTAAWRSLLDQEAAVASHTERVAMRDAFLTSSRYEYLFWEMAYTQEHWPL